MLESVEKITWKLGEPADWPQIFGPDEVHFACMCCRAKTATYKATMPDGYGIVCIVLCPDCVTKDAPEILARLKRRGNYE